MVVKLLCGTRILMGIKVIYKFNSTTAEAVGGASDSFTVVNTFTFMELLLTTIPLSHNGIGLNRPISNGNLFTAKLLKAKSE